MKEIYNSRIFGFFFLLQFFIYFTSPYFPLDLFGHILSFSLKADANSHWRLQLMKLHLLPHHEILRWKRSWAPECFAFGDVFCNCIPHTSGRKSQPRSKSPPIPILFRTHLTNQNIKNYFFKKYIFVLLWTWGLSSPLCSILAESLSSLSIWAATEKKVDKLFPFKNLTNYYDNFSWL